MYVQFTFCVQGDCFCDTDSNIDVLLDQNHLDDTTILTETYINATVEMQGDGFQELDKKFQKYIDSVQESIVRKSENVYTVVSTDIRVRKVTLSKGNIYFFFYHNNL